MDSKLKKNLVMNVAYQILLIFVPLVTSPYIARVLGAEKIGQYSYAHTIANYFILVAMLGIQNYGTREIARVRDDAEKTSKLYSQIYSIQLICSFIMILAYIVFAVTRMNAEMRISVIMVILVISAAFDVSWLFSGLEKYQAIVIVNSIIKVVSTALIFLFVKSIDDLLIYAIIMACGVTASALSLRIIAWQSIKFNFTIQKAKDHLKPIVMLFLPWIAISIYRYMDKIMLGSFSTMTELGFYENAEKIVSIPITLVAAVGSVMLSRTSYYLGGGDHNSIKATFEKSITVLTILTVLIASAIVGVAPIFCPIYFGEEFVDCADIINILCISLPFMAWANVVRTQVLIPRRKDSVYISTLSIGAVVNLILNTLLITRLGANGAAIGTVVAEVVVAVSQSVYVSRDKECKFAKPLMLSLLSCVFGAGLILALRMVGEMLGSSISTLVIQAIIVLFVFATVVLIYLFREIIERKQRKNV